MKSEIAIQAMHDLIAGVILRQTSVELSSRDQNQFVVAYDALCWVLGRDHVSDFELAATRLLRQLRREGFSITLTKPIEVAQRVALREAGERFIMIDDMTGADSIQCLTCGVVSRSERDVVSRHCPGCEANHMELLERDVAAVEAQYGSEDAAEGGHG